MRRPTEIVLEKCATEGDGVEKLDADANGQAEIFRSVSDGREICRVVDLNFDGRPDRTTYFDEAGRIRRIESDFDRDGRVDEIVLFKDGKIAEKHRAASLAGKLDTWEFYEEGKLVRTERDENGDGIIDQWWEYPSDQCPLIHSDSDGDGRPDPAATIDYCKATGFVPPPPQNENPTNTGPSFQLAPGTTVTTVTTVTEVSNEPAEGSKAQEEQK